MKTFYKNLFLTLLIYISANEINYAQAPSIQWQKSLGGTNYEQAESVKQTFDGGYIVAGISTSTNGNVTGNHGFGDFWIVKLTPSGTIDWQHSYGGSGDDGAFSIEQLPDSGYIIAGSSVSTNGNVTGNHGALDFWIVRIDKAGILLWQKSLGGSSDEIPYDIHHTTDNGFIVAGYTNSNNGNVTTNHGFNDYWIVKLDSAGGIAWQKSYGGTDDDKAYSVQQTSDGGYVACGYTRSIDGDVTNNHGDYDYWVIKLDSAGTLQWQHALGGSLDDKAHSVSQTFDGGFIVSGFTASSDSDVTFNHGFEDLWMVKLDSAGTIQWEKSLGGSGVDQAYFIKQTSDSGFIAAGSSYSLDGDVTGNHGGYDYWVVKTDSMGTIEWDKSLGGTSVEEAYCIEQTDSGGYIIAGGTLSNDGDVTNNHGDFDYWIVKLDSTMTTGIDSDKDVHSFNVYPNPSSTFITFTTKENLDGLIQINDMRGRKIISKKLTMADEKIDLSDFANGIYTVQLISEKNTETRKLAIQK